MLDHHVAYVEKIVENGGPEPWKWPSFNQWLREIGSKYREGILNKEQLSILRDSFGEALSPKTLQGFSLEKPHGYTGDFEIIDRMYTQHVTDHAHLKRWDEFFQSRASVQAVRNRKRYFQELLRSMEETHADRTTLPVLDVASGPARDIHEYFSNNGHAAAVTFDCIDNDPSALEYASKLCAPHTDRITFEEVNALRYRTNTEYQLVWSAGLFDYLGDKGFKFLLERLVTFLRDDGELVVGNFSPRNPTRDYMEIVGDWHLYYRSESELIDLATECGIPEEDIRIGSESQGVNLFLHVKRGDRFLDLSVT